MNASQSLVAGSSLHWGSVGSLIQPTETRPTDFSSPAGISTDATEAETKLITCSGFHPRSLTLRMACAANFGIETLKNTSAPDACSATIWESIVGSVTS